MNENSVVNGAEPKNSPPEALIPPVPDDFDPSTFRQEFAQHNGVIFIMLRNIVPKTTGLEMSAFRRAKLFREKFGIDVYLITNHYQTDLLEQCAAYGLDFPVLNFYDYYQEFDRKVKPSPEEIGDPKGEQDARFKRRDTPNKFGFLSRRHLIDPDTNRTMEALFYRADGSIAVREVYDYPDDKINVKRVELIDRNGSVKHSFNTRNDAIAHWVLELVSDKSKQFYLIGDRTPEYHPAYIEMKRQALDNVHVLHQLHNLHVLPPNDPFTSRTKVRYKYLYDKSLQSDIILALTKRQGRDIAKRYNLENAVVLPHSLAAVPKVKDVERDPFKIVQVGRINEEKGHAKSVEVMRRVLDYVPQAHLHFYGRGPLQESVQKLIDEAGFGDRIKFEGFVDNMPAVFASAALSILPSTFEGFGLVVQESMQQGCPVVAFDCNYGPDEIIEDGVSGYLVPVDDIDAMADRIIRILTDDDLRERFSSNCAQSLKKFAPDVVARQWAWLFHNLINGK